MAEIIGGRFQIGEPLGQGGMGVVYHGLDTQTQAKVAIKLLKPELVTSNREMVERFIREAEALRRLNHPNIVKMLASVDEGDRHYLIMEYMSGGSLADLLRTQPEGMSIERALRIGLELADALTRAHHLKIIHRDIKPANVLLAEDGTPRLTDFGIARISDESRMTGSGMVVGTFAYLSPEACEGRELDGRTDIWAFGVMLYEMLTGRKPFDESTTAATITAILMKTPPDLYELRPDAPPALVTLIERMLAKNRDERIGSIRQVGAEIEAILEGRTTNLTATEKMEPYEPITPPPSSRFATPTPLDGPTTLGEKVTPSQPAAPIKVGRQRRLRGFMQGAGWFMAGIGVFSLLICICSISLIGNLFSNANITFGTPLPTLLTVIPITPPPLVQDGEYLVLVAPFEAVRTDARDVSRFITDDLQQQFTVEAPFSQIKVMRSSNVVRSDNDALKEAISYGAAVVVWGSYTAEAITANVQIGTLSSFKYNVFDRETLTKTANVRVQMTDETKESIAHQVLGTLNVLFLADGDLYGYLRTLAVYRALDVTDATAMGSGIPTLVQQYFSNYSDASAAIANMSGAIDRESSNVLLYQLRIFARGNRLNTQYEPNEAIPQSEVDLLESDLQAARRLAPEKWAMAYYPYLARSSQEIVDQYTKMLEQRPDDWYLYFRLGAAYADNGNLETARTKLDEAMQLNSEVVFPKVASLLIALRQGAAADAATFADQILKNQPPDLNYINYLDAAESGTATITSNLLPLIKILLGQNQEAVNYLRVVVTQSSGQPADLYLLLLGIAQCNLGSRDAAVAAFDLVTDTIPVAYLLNASIQVQQHDLPGAQRTIAAAMRTEQSNLLAPFAAAVLNGEFGCGDLFDSEKVTATQAKYATVTSVNLIATLTPEATTELTAEVTAEVTP